MYSEHTGKHCESAESSEKSRGTVKIKLKVQCSWVNNSCCWGGSFSEVSDTNEPGVFNFVVDCKANCIIG
jgi:hypothetical protein